MKERPILFSAPMVRALLDGSKTQHRLVVKPVAMLGGWEISNNARGDETSRWPLGRGLNPSPCPYGQPGDQLWVREAFRAARGYDKLSPLGLISLIGAGEIGIHYECSGSAPATAGKLRPGIHMPRSFSRITLEVTSVRVERLQDISRGDAMAEGCPFQNMAQGDDPRKWYADLWRQINGPDSWAANSWVWIIEFKRVQP